VQIVAPPSAVRAEALRSGTVVAKTDLANGLGKLKLAPASSRLFRVYDASGTVIAELPYEDVTGVPDNAYFEPTIKGW